MLEHNAVSNFTGDNLSCSFLNTFKKFGLETTYIRQHVTGLVVVGQIINIDVGNYLQDTLAKTVIMSCDPMHRI